MDIGSRLDKAMKASGLSTQTALSKKSDVSQSTINRILKNKGESPDAMTVYRLAKACAVSVEYLLTGEQTQKNGVHLAYITTEEALLLSKYRECSEEAKSYVQTSVEAALKLPE